MPIYEVIEVRAYQVTHRIEAESEDAARRLDGAILSETETDSWSERIHSVEEVEGSTAGKA